MMSAEVRSVSGLQAHRSADNCLASCLYNDGVVQAVTFAYLIYTDEFLVCPPGHSNAQSKYCSA